MNIWDTFTVGEKQCYLTQVGPLKLWIEYKNREWLIASDRVPGEKEVFNREVLGEAPEQVVWNRFVLPGKERRVTLLPATPDRSVVVKPESALTIAAGASALFFVLIPIWVHVTVGTQQRHLVTELPTQILSNTWFGEPYNGDLCYSLKIWAKRSLEGLIPRPHQAVCPVYIRNISTHDLDFNRLCIRTEFLNIYRGSSWLWTNKVNVQFRGESQTSKIRYDSALPEFEPACQLMAHSRQRPAKDFSIKSFDTFNSKKQSGG